MEGPEDEACLRRLQRLAGWYPSPDPYVRAQYEALEEELSSLTLATYTRLVAHGDCGPKDFYFDGDRLTGVLDFGAARPDYALFDIATMMMYTGIFPRDKGAEYASFIRAYLQGYPLRAEELRGLHTFLKTRFLIQVFYHLMRYREGVTQGLISREENIQGIEDGKAMLQLLEEVPRNFYLRLLESTA